MQSIYLTALSCSTNSGTQYNSETVNTSMGKKTIYQQHNEQFQSTPQNVETTEDTQDNYEDVVVIHAPLSAENSDEEAYTCMDIKGNEDSLYEENMYEETDIDMYEAVGV